MHAFTDSPSRHQRTARHSSAHGFTLIEVMVAIALMAVMAAVSWRGIDGLLRAQAYTERNATDQAVLQTSFMQWQTDLDHMSNILALTPLDWDGKVMRITRASARISPTDAPTVLVVAWSERQLNGQKYWLRWQSRPIVNREQWREAWSAAQLWSQGQGTSSQGQETALLPIIDWQIYYAREGRWTNPLSSDTPTPPAPPPGPPDGGAGSGNQDNPARYTAADAFFALPDAIRLQVDLAPPQQLSGRITRDWLRPSYGRTQ